MWTWLLEKDGWTKYALNLPSLCCWLRSFTFIWNTCENLGKIVLPRKLSYKALVTCKLKIYADLFLFPRGPKTKWPQLSSVHVFCISLMGTLNAWGIMTSCSKRTPLIFATSSLLFGKKVSMLSCECMATYIIMFFRTWQTNCWDLSSWTLISNCPKAILSDHRYGNS